MALNHDGDFSETSVFDEELLYGGGNSGASSTSTQAAFLLSGDIVFGPYYVPKRISVTKKRELNRQGNFCGGEDVTDLGSKNREIHVSGRIREDELIVFENLLDNDRPLDLTTHGWTGEVMVKNGEYEGPVARDSETREYLFQYSLDLVSTGRDEQEAKGGGPTDDPYDTDFSDEQLERLENGEITSL